MQAPPPPAPVTTPPEDRKKTRQKIPSYEESLKQRLNLLYDILYNYEASELNGNKNIVRFFNSNDVCGRICNKKSLQSIISSLVLISVSVFNSIRDLLDNR